MDLRLERRQSVYQVSAADREYAGRLDEGEQNEVIFNLLTRVIQAEYAPGMTYLKIAVPENYLVDAINRTPTGASSTTSSRASPSSRAGAGGRV